MSIFAIVSLIALAISLTVCLFETRRYRRRQRMLEEDWAARLEAQERADDFRNKLLDAYTVLRLACGARLVHLDDEMAHLLLNGVEKGKRDLVREGDLVVLCVDGCVLGYRCPLVEDYIKIENVHEYEKILHRIVGNNDLAGMERNTPHIGNGNLEKEHVSSFVSRFKGFLTNLEKRPGLVIPPVLLEMNNRDNYLADEVHRLQNDVDYMRRHSNPFNPPLKSLREGETARCPFCGANAQRAVSARSTKED